MSSTSDERRTRARQRSFLQGRLYFNNRRSSLDCLVRDISGTGAKLKVSDSVAIPEIVELHIPNKDETYRAKVQWRTGFELGLTFDGDQDAPSIVPGAARQQDLGEAAGRGAKVEACAAFRIKAEMIERGGKFDAAARHPRMRRRGPQDAVERERIRRLADQHVIGGHQASFDRRLRPGAALEQPAFDQQKISAFASGHQA